MGEATPNTNSHILEDITPLKFPQILRGKKILLATESYGPINGVSKTTQNLVSYLRSQGVQLAVVAPEISTSSFNPSPLSISNNTKPDPTNPDPANPEIEIRLKGYPLPYDPSLSIVYPVRLSKIYERTFREAPDLIYLASPASLGFQILLQHRLSQISSTHPSQIPILLNFQTDLSGYCEILFPSPLSTFAVHIFRSVQGYLFRHPSVLKIFYPSNFVRRYLESAGVQPSKLVNLRRGVDGSLFHPSKRSEERRKEFAPNGEIILVSVSRIAPEKGFDFLADVVKSLDERGFEFKLVIVGGNRNPQVVREIQGMFGNLVEKRKVVFTGMLKGEDLAGAYASADLFVHCSVTETFGLVVLESMASGVPVVARDEGGPSEIVAHGSSGYLVPPRDLDGFAERIIDLGSNTLLRTEMGSTSRKMAEEATWESIGNKVAWELANILEEESTSKPQPQTSSTSVPVYSWVLISSTVRRGIATLAADSRVMGGMGIIVGVWGGLVVTWGLVQVSLGVKGVIPRLRKFFGLKYGKKERGVI